MSEFEEKLAAYRMREKRKRQIERFKNIFLKPVLLCRDEKKKFDAVIEDEKESIQPVTSTEEANAINSTEVIQPTADVAEESFKWKNFFMSLFVWCCFFRYAVYIEFGAVFLLLSGFYLIWINTRTGPKRVNELSAYSVFNPNCERIEGTLDAEQLEKEIRYGIM